MPTTQTSAKKDEQMTNAKQFMVSDNSINVVYQAEKEISSLKGVNRENNEEANGHKMTAYGEVIASIAQIKQVKGKLPRAIQQSLKNALLQEAGLSAATVKRYHDNSVAAVRMIKDKIGDIPTQYTGAAVVADLAAMEIDSENKLVKAAFGEANKTKARMLAEKVVGKFSTEKTESGKRVQGSKFRDGLDDEELEEFHNIVRELMAARKAYRDTVAAKAAEKAAKDENNTVDAVVDEMLDALA